MNLNPIINNHQPDDVKLSVASLRGHDALLFYTARDLLAAGTTQAGVTHALTAEQLSCAGLSIPDLRRAMLKCVPQLAAVGRYVGLVEEVANSRQGDVVFTLGCELVP